MTYLPDPSVAFDGVNVTVNAIESVRVDRGRLTVYDDAKPGFASVRLLADDALTAPAIGQELTLDVNPGFAVDATGGDSVADADTRDGLFQVHKFTTVGSSSFTLVAPAVVDVLVVSGGGFGDADAQGGKGGGGGGGLALFSKFLSPGSYSVAVGAGGTLGSPNGGSSTFDDLTIVGGGGGGELSGASGGGARVISVPLPGGNLVQRVAGPPGVGIVPFGNNGGAAAVDGSSEFGGGGGGFRFVGGDATTSAGGPGGSGLILDFDGVALDYASGGGGSARVTVGSGVAPIPGEAAPGGGASGGQGEYRSASLIAPSPFTPIVVPGTAGQPNTGGGGGAGGHNGGSGVVMVRVPKRIRTFTGTVSDVRVSPVRVQGGLLFSYDVTAVGPLARVARRNVFASGRVGELDGQRVAGVVDGAFGLTWGENPADQSWGDVPTTTTWIGVDPIFSLGVIDRGDFDLAGLEAEVSGYAALSVANESATSGRGLVLETAGGIIGYTSRRGRFRELRRDPITFSFNDVQVDSFDARLSVGDVANVVNVDWDAGTVTGTNVESVRALGRYARTVKTVLANESDAQSVADESALLQGEARFRLQAVTLNLRGVSDDAVREELLRLPIGRALSISDVPSPLGETTFTGFVEGVDFGTGEFESVLTLFVSDARFSVPQFQPIQATGGVVSDVEIDGRLFRVHEFTTPGLGSLSVTNAGDEGIIDTFVLAGGGGGGGGGNGSGGGGAGGLLLGSREVSTPAPGFVFAVAVTVGAGGAGAGVGTTSQGADGGSSQVSGVGTAAGGGGGGANSVNLNGRSGGSGGGGGTDGTTDGTGGAGTSGQGFAGGDGFFNAGGGGGGAGGAGSVGVLNQGANGGSAVVDSFGSVARRFGQGGRGTSVFGGPGVLSAVGGGGGGSFGGADALDGGAGVVLVRYPLEAL